MDTEISPPYGETCTGPDFTTTLTERTHMKTDTDTETSRKMIKWIWLMIAITTGFGAVAFSKLDWSNVGLNPDKAQEGCIEMFIYFVPTIAALIAVLWVSSKKDPSTNGKFLGISMPALIILAAIFIATGKIMGTAQATGGPYDPSRIAKPILIAIGCLFLTATAISAAKKNSLKVKIWTHDIATSQ